MTQLNSRNPSAIIDHAPNMHRDQERQHCVSTILKALTDLKAKEIVEFDIRHKSNFTDYIVIASGTSTRHVKALADNVFIECKQAGYRPLGMEGERDAEWVLIDLGFVVVHVMMPTARKFYDLENLWRSE